MYGNFSQQINPYLARLNEMQNQNQNMQNMQMQMPNQMPLQSYQVIHVNGENGAKAFRMMPNSQALLLDDTASLIWFCQSDGAGYHTVTPYQITPYQAQPEPDVIQILNGFDARLKKLEEITNDKSNSKPNAKRNSNEKQSNADDAGIQ